MKDIRDLFDYELGSLYDAEHKTVKVLVRMASKCENPELVKILEEYRALSENRVGRLEAAFELAGRTPHRIPCAGINGLITEFSDFVETEHSPGVLDAFAVEAARRIERYSICAYQALITLAVALKRDEVTELLATSLAEHSLAGDNFKALSINLTENLLAEAGE